MTTNEAKNCPFCRLTNPPSAMRCDCGYDFVAADATPARQQARSLGRDPASRAMAAGIGALLTLGGVALVGFALWGVSATTDHAGGRGATKVGLYGVALILSRPTERETEPVREPALAEK